jgi:hypothetical protein
MACYFLLYLLPIGQTGIIQISTQCPSASFTAAMTLPVHTDQLCAFASPVALTPTMIAKAIKEEIRAYSMDVTPNWNFMADLPFLMAVTLNSLPLGEPCQTSQLQHSIELGC